MRLLVRLMLCAGVVFAMPNLAWADYASGLAAANKGDFGLAQKEWEASAKKGDVNAQYNLGALLLSGKVGPQDPKKAIKWIEQAANKGQVDAAYSLGLLYYTGSREFKQ
jgi:uncharacterized protein